MKWWSEMSSSRSTHVTDANMAAAPSQREKWEMFVSSLVHRSIFKTFNCPSVFTVLYFNSFTTNCRRKMIFNNDLHEITHWLIINTWRPADISLCREFSLQLLIKSDCSHFCIMPTQFYSWRRCAGGSGGSGGSGGVLCAEDTFF